jgi:hypothetical protein
MLIFVFEVFSREPVCAELAINLQFRTAVFQMLLDTQVAPDFLTAAEAFDDEAMAFDLYVFFKILKHDRLLHGFG